MGKHLATLLLAIFLLANTEITELLRLPRLISHYTLHLQKGYSESFLSFLSDHYAADREHIHTRNEHGRLPGKSGDCLKCASMVMLLALPQIRLMADEIPVYQRANYTYRLPSSTPAGVEFWQPPQDLG